MSDFINVAQAGLMRVLAVLRALENVDHARMEFTASTHVDAMGALLATRGQVRAAIALVDEILQHPQLAHWGGPHRLNPRPRQQSVSSPRRVTDSPKCYIFSSLKQARANLNVAPVAST
jgi:hypothetical protein